MEFLEDYMEDLTGKKQSDKKELEMHFNQIDINGDGEIDKNECTKFLNGFNLGNQLKEMMEAMNN